MKYKGTYQWGLIAAIILVLEAITAVVWSTAWWMLDREVPAFRIERPEMLWGMLAGPLLGLVFLINIAWRNRALKRFASAETLARMVPSTSSLRVLLRFLLFRHGLSFLVVALAGPQFGTRLEEVRSEGIDLVVAVDVSNSMECEDLRPSRMEAARRAMSQLVDRLRGDRLGIVVFAGEAYVQLPITTDRSAAKLFLSTVNTSSVGTQGTAIGAAIELAQQSFDPETPGNKAIIVITDGENHEDDAEGAARAAAAAGIVVHTVGMGTPEGGPLPTKRNGKVIGFRKDAGGNVVVSRLNEAMLRRIAAEGNGAYVRANSASSGMEGLVADLRQLETTEKGSYMYTGHDDQFQYPLGVGIIMVLLSLSFGERRHWRTSWNKYGPSLASIVIMASTTGCGTAEERAAERALYEGEHPYRTERFADAVEIYARGGADPRVQHNLGNAEYRSARWDSAIAAYGKSVMAFTSAHDQASAAHNLGNAWSAAASEADSASIRILERIRTIRIDGDDIGRKVHLMVERDSLRKLNIEQIQLVDSALAQAAEAYKAALRRNPADEDTRHNLALAQYRIAERIEEADADGDKGEENGRAELSQEAKEIMAKADELVEQYRFKEALNVMQDGLKAHPTLQQEQAYVQKLDVVTKAAEAK
ncbi:MAG: VWA domain-containing protein [Flavobacteriales bacterium]|nr:VWA domain-containing protein [Flavobacteriales bacterium]